MTTEGRRKIIISGKYIMSVTPCFYRYSPANHNSATCHYGNPEQFGLTPQKRFVRCYNRVLLDNTSDKSTKPAFFGLLAPLDPAWCIEDHYSGSPMLQAVLEDIPCNDVSLLKISVEPGDKVFVGDYGVHLETGFKGYEYSDPDIVKRVTSAYVKSLIPFEEYIPGTHRLPEVACFQKMPASRIRIIETQSQHRLSELIRTIKNTQSPPAPSSNAPSYKRRAIDYYRNHSP